MGTATSRNHTTIREIISKKQTRNQSINRNIKSESYIKHHHITTHKSQCRMQERLKKESIIIRIKTSQQCRNRYLHIFTKTTFRQNTKNKSHATAGNSRF